jgi:pyruvate formate lyase activating enzyme
MTLSGGEPTLQLAFSEALLRGAREAGLHCCVETCGHCAPEALERLRPLVDIWLYDWKETDPGRHRDYTGADNRLILANLKRLHAAGDTVWLRCPIVPGFNDRQDHLEGIAALAAELPGLAAVELMPYHKLGEGKRERLGLPPGRTRDAATPSRERVREWARTLAELGIKVRTDAA